MSDILNQTMKMVRSYATNMNILVVDDEEDILQSYKMLFGRFFKVCDVARDGQEALDIWLSKPSYYDLIVTDVDMPRMNGLDLIKSIREKSLSQSVIVVTGNRDLSTNQDISYYYVDAILPKPFNFKSITPLLGRVLKKISDQKDLELYLQQLEQYSIDSINTKLNVKTLVDKLTNSDELDKDSIIEDLGDIQKHKNSEIKVSGNKLTSTQMHDIRFTATDNVTSASQLMEILDDTIIDKTENLLEHIDTFVEVLYKMEDSDLTNTMTHLPYLRKTIVELSQVLEAIGLFDILVRASKSLAEFLDAISEEQLSDESKKALLISMILGLIQDMENWIKIVFIEKNTDNIYYFDASFSNNCLEIVAIFNEEEVVTDDDDDLEFF